MTVKHYIGKIEERNGEFEYSEKILFATSANPSKHLDKLVREWRGCTKSDWDEEEGGYWSDCTLIFAGDWNEIPHDDFNVLQKYITVL